MNRGVTLQPEARYDSSHLARGGTGKDSSIVLGMGLFILIEATVVLSLATAYLYFRVSATAGWPPPGFELPRLLRPTGSVVLLGAGGALVLLSNRAAARECVAHCRLALSAAILLAMAYLTLSSVELESLSYDWTRDVYASLVWTLSGYQYFHAVAAITLSAGVLALGWRGRFMGARRAPLQALALYWALVVASAVVNYFIVYISPHVP